MTKARIKTRDGDWYVAVTHAEWPAAHKRMQRAVERRAKRLLKWEAANKPAGYPPASYWEAYATERARIPIEWPIPAGHVMFGAIEET